MRVEYVSWVSGVLNYKSEWHQVAKKINIYVCIYNAYVDIYTVSNFISKCRLT